MTSLSLVAKSNQLTYLRTNLNEILKQLVTSIEMTILAISKDFDYFAFYDSNSNFCAR